MNIGQFSRVLEKCYMHLNIVTFNRKEGKELTMRCVTVTTMTAPTTVATIATLIQEGSSITNQIPLALYQAGPVGLPRLHLQIARSPHQTAVLSCILMVVAQRMVEMVPGLALVCTGALRIPGTCLSAHVK